MKSLAAWGSARTAAADKGDAGEDTERGYAVDQLIDAIAEALFNTIIEGRALLHHRRHSEDLQHWMRRQSRVMQSAFERNVSNVKERMMRGVSENLLPLLKRHIEQKSLEDFLSAIDSQTLEAKDVAFKISVPASLAGVVESEMKKRRLEAIVTENSREELVANFGETCIESRMAAAGHKAEELLANG